MAEKENLDGQTLLPISRIRTIMKSSPDVSNISQEALFMIAKSTELFVQELSRRSQQESEDKTSVGYNALAEIVDTQETLQFLQDTVPKKITVRDYYASIGKKDKFASEDGDGDS